VTYTQTRAAAAVKVAARLGVHGSDPVILADGANVVVHLSPAPVVAKVAASTTAIRPAAAWLQRELDVAQFLAGRGAPVMSPSPEVPATVHHGDGQVMSFWRYLSPSANGTSASGLAGRSLASEDVIGPMLRDLHAELSGYPGQLPVLGPLQDIPSYLARPQTSLTPAEAAALSAAHTRLMAELGSFPARPLHGDAGAGNLMATGSGWVWHDFEDTCSGPVTWDLAASTASQRLDGRHVLAAYGESVDAAQLATCEQLRRLHLTVWYSLYAERLPDLRSRAAELLALWPPP
jgi:Ser/Thr protein kinase RdoA (MazF antagonist)